jgi:ribosomal-protein-serine acetyltransferase
MFTALYSDSIKLVLIEEHNLNAVRELFAGYPDSDVLLEELNADYLPQFADGRRVNYGFYVLLEQQLAGLCLLEVNDWQVGIASTGADMLLHMRGQGITPRSKPHLFFLAFELLGLNRVETGCFVSNLASKKSIEKTQGFLFEGRSRQSGINDDGELEDEFHYAILKQDWLELYNKTRVQVLYEG